MTMECFPDPNVNEIKEAIKELQKYCLFEASSWLCEKLEGLQETQYIIDEQKEETQIRSSVQNLDQQLLTYQVQFPSYNTLTYEEGKIFFAQSCFHQGEYRRAIQKLQKCISSQAIFLEKYCQYLAGEQWTNDERLETVGLLGKSNQVNQELQKLDSDLSLQCQDVESCDPFLLYLYGLVLTDRKSYKDALAIIIASVNKFPYNWNAWKVLLLLSEHVDEIPYKDLPKHWCTEFFLANLYCTTHSMEALNKLKDLASIFIDSYSIITLAAKAHYEMKNYGEASNLFEEVLRKDSCNLDCMDIYSNILYVRDLHSRLSNLAQMAANVDKYRPETQCIIGNFYSLNGAHEQAVSYFQRALRLNPGYLAAWTLMGHEYVEMKNPKAAIYAYRHTVDVNKKDYRAWYGLGQTYEMMGMPYYSLYYFQQAARLRPQDSRMWVALGQCYENDQIRMDDGAIRCYRRAIEIGDRENIALHKLAQLHAKLNDRHQAAHYFQKNLNRLDHLRVTGQDLVEALMYLAEYFKDESDYDQAITYCMRLQDFGGNAKEKARSLLNECKSLKQENYGAQPNFSS